MPSPRSFSSASRTGVALTPSLAAVSSSRMNVPGRSAPDMIAARRWPATSSDSCARRSGSAPSRCAERRVTVGALNEVTGVVFVTAKTIV